jgi:hypothetical protein
MTRQRACLYLVVVLIIVALMNLGTTVSADGNISIPPITPSSAPATL